MVESLCRVVDWLGGSLSGRLVVGWLVSEGAPSDSF